jgi:SPX domain protein involved in polyphosphate accumulation
MIEDYRYERKFKVFGVLGRDLEQMVKVIPGMFREVYQRRHVNNIYLDTDGMKSYIDNVEGLLERTKYRIRWYGNLMGRIASPTLEAKHKKDLLGRKKHFKLEGFLFDNRFTIETLRSVFRNSDLSLAVLACLANLKPTLVNRYSRKYFLSDDKKLRITVDSDLSYYKISNYSNNFTVKYDDKNTIVELKYDAVNDQCPDLVSNCFPFTLSKFSKYVNGINYVSRVRA